jgi:hypothetical protein
MSVPRLVRIVALLAVPLCAMTLTAPASASQAAPGAGILSLAARPDAASAMAGYVWSGSPVSVYTYNSTGGSVSVTTPIIGQYQATFGNLGSIADDVVPQVTTYATTATCAVGGWEAAAGDLQVDVDCFGLNGSPVAADFDLIVTHPTSTPHGVFDFAYAADGTRSGTLCCDQYNSAGKQNSVKFLGTGRYQLTLGGPKTSGTHGTVKVSPDGAVPGDCELVGWRGSKQGEVVDVDCFSDAGARQDRSFMVSYASSNNLMGLNGKTEASALASGAAAVYQPSVQYDSTRGARVTVVRYSTGTYEVLFAGSEGTSANGGDIQVNAVGSSDRHCIVDYWAQQFTPAAYIHCFGNNGNPANSPFAVDWVVA